jgi:hypothetical protein
MYLRLNLRNRGSTINLFSVFFNDAFSTDIRMTDGLERIWKKEVVA